MVGDFYRCLNSGDVSGTDCSIGGIVGATYDYSGADACVVEECNNQGKINAGNHNVGGIVGIILAKASVLSCENSADVISKGQYTGGIVGVAQPNTESSIETCTNNAKISGSVTTGGITAYQSASVLVTNCNNNGDVQSGGLTSVQSNSTGGIVGLSYGAIKECTNTGNVLAHEAHRWNRAGGIVGYYGADSLEKSVENCKNYGNINAIGENTYMAVSGGIVGDGNCTMVITNCYNSGNIFANKVSYGYIGGILGRTQDQSASKTLTLNNCYSKGSVKVEEISVLSRVGSIGGTVGTAGVTDSYYYNGFENCPKALNNQDFENQKVMGIAQDFNNFDEFVQWLSENSNV